MLKQFLLVGAAALSFPALAQTTPPGDAGAPPTEQPDAATAQPAPAEPADTATGSGPATAPAPTESAQPAPSRAAATPTQIAQIVDREFPSYDGDKSGDLNQAEFAAWMKKLRTASDPTVDPEAEQVKTWVGQAWAVADADKSGAVSKDELTGFLSRGA